MKGLLSCVKSVIAKKSIHHYWKAMLNPFYRQPLPTWVILIFKRKYWAAFFYDFKKIWTLVDKGFMQCNLLKKQQKNNI